MNKTKIDWVKNPDGSQGMTWNPITGCLNGCEYCYARKLANTRLKERYLANKRVSTKTSLLSEYEDALSDPFYPRFWEDRILEPWDIHGKLKPKGIFVCDMSDLFGIGIPEKWTGDVLDVIRFSKTHRFYLLTKQPQNLAKFSPFPDNCWVGVTATGFNMSAHALYGGMAKIEAKIKFLSYEPLLENVNIMPADLINTGIQWVIIGALTGTKADLLPLHHKTGLIMVRLNGNRWSLQPQIDWVREIIRACDEAGVKVFLKNNLKLLIDKSPNIAGLTQYGSAKLRQEIPV